MLHPKRALPWILLLLFRRSSAMEAGKERRIPAGLNSVWMELLPLVSSAISSKDTELEVRFGLGDVRTREFPNGVSERAFHQLQKILHTSHQNGKMEMQGQGWQRIRDLHFCNSIRSTYYENGEKETVFKRLLQRTDMVGHNLNQVAGSSEACHLRFSWKTEQPVNDGVTEIGPLEGVREKRRISYIYKMWRYDLTIVYGAPVQDYSMIDAALQTAVPSFEVEMEYLPKLAPASPSLPPAYVAHSMLLKAQDVCGFLLGNQVRPEMMMRGAFLEQPVALAQEGSGRGMVNGEERQPGVV